MSDALLVTLFLAALGDRIAKVLFVPLLDLFVKPRVVEAFRVWIYMIVCAIPGAFMAWLMQVDVFAYIGLMFPAPWGMVISSMTIGFGANFVHEVVALARASRQAYVA